MSETTRFGRETTVVGVLVLLCRIAAGATFLYASLDKIADPAGFARAVSNYHVLPVQFLHVFALVLPWLEAVVGVALIVGVGARGASLLALIMTTMFIVAIIAALARDLDISCGCFHTDGGHAVGMSLIWRDVLLWMACFLPLWARHDGWALQRWLGRPKGAA